MESKVVDTQRYIPYHVLITKWLPSVRGPPPFYLASRIRDVFIALLMNNDVNIGVFSDYRYQYHLQKRIVYVVFLLFIGDIPVHQCYGSRMFIPDPIFSIPDLEWT
jgi:hypothetical protein